jgi:CubicO group peptidase (beta-lactamase class C family)
MIHFFLPNLIHTLHNTITLKKQTALFFFLTLFILLMNRAGNNVFAQPPTHKKHPTTQTNTLYSPKKVGMNPAKMARIDAIVQTGIEAKAFPGCQVLVMKNGKTIYDKCFGYYTYEAKQKVTSTTLYDLASLSKTTGTLLAIMKLYDNGELKLTDKVSTYLSFLQNTDKKDITIADLLFHESGLPASISCYRLATTKDTVHGVRIGLSAYKTDWVSKTPSETFTIQVSDSFYLPGHFHQDVLQMIAHTPLRSKTYLYSCVNFILLKEIAETISGKPMDVFLDSLFYFPMELSHMTYRPLLTHQKEDIAPTVEKDFLRNGILQGYVHDPDAAFLGGVSGNAGLFASARDVAMVYQMLLNDGQLDGTRYLSTATCRLFTTSTSASGRRYLGFDKPVPEKPAHSPCCSSAPAAVYGHTGYTGTCCWVDPVNKLVYVFLSNRTYPEDKVNKLAKMGIRTKIQEVLYQSLSPFK